MGREMEREGEGGENEGERKERNEREGGLTLDFLINFHKSSILGIRCCLLATQVALRLPRVPIVY